MTRIPMPAQNSGQASRPVQEPNARPAANNVAKGAAGHAQAGLVAATALLKLESDLRQIRSLAEFGYFIANETRLVTRSQQTFMLMQGEGGVKVAAVSAITSVDRSAPLVNWVETLVDRLGSEMGLQSAQEFDSSSFNLAKAVDFPNYPLRFMLWVPFADLKGRVVGGMLQARSTPWTEADLVVSKHVASACSYALLVLTNASPLWRLSAKPSRKILVSAAVAMLALFFLPVSMSALAPVEVAPNKPYVVTAPVDGVIDSVLIDPNAAVTKGQPLVRMADTVLRNRLEVAEREVLVADAKVKKVSQLAFVDPRGRHELGVSQAELELRRAERDYARDILERSTIRAERDGIAFYSDPKELIGRPVAVGERLMELADPARMEFRIDLSVADAIVLREGARVKVFLDADPLRPIDARLVRADFQARLRENQQLAFRLVAEKLTEDTKPIRLGVRGTAQVYSDKVTLGFYLFRRPISAARQWFGI